MKTIILAAGRGSRLGERTREKPKCMCTLKGRTLLDRCLETLMQAGIAREEIGIVTGYRSDMFHEPGITYFHNADWERTNMFYSLTMAEAWLAQEPCLVCYSDIVFTPAAVRALAASGAPAAITSYSGYWALWKARMDDPLEDLETFRAAGDGRLLEIGQKPAGPEQVQGQFMGLLRFTPESWGWVRETLKKPLRKTVEKLDMTTLLEGMVRAGYPIQTISTDGLWLECDSEHDIDVYEQLFGDRL